MEKCQYRYNGIRSLESLARHLRVPKKLINDVSNRPCSENYSDPKVVAYKSDGSQRRIKTPKKDLRIIQRQINKNLFKDNVLWPSYLFGSLPTCKSVESGEESSRDYISAAQVHCRSKSICKLDVKNFFDNVHRDYVKAVFKHVFKCSDNVAEKLTVLTTYQDNLVQGALTSSYLAMLILYDVEPILVRSLERKGIKYSRLVDDITLSSGIYNFEFDWSKREVQKVLNQKGLSMNQDKVDELSVSTDLLTVHGLNVSFSHPCLSKGEAKRIRASVRHLEKICLDESVRTEIWYRREFNKCRGRVYKLDRLGKRRSCKKLLNRLSAIAPIPSSKDVRYAKRRVSKLESDYGSGNKRATYSYKRRYSIACHRVSFIKLKYPESWGNLRKRLKNIPPEYDNY